jgi:hypothetical protein
MDVLPSLYADWDRWACEVADGHTKYPVLNQFRLPRSRHHWLLSLVAMMDAAAIDLSVRDSVPAEARLFLLSATACLTNDLAAPLRISNETTQDTAVTDVEFFEAFEQLVEHGYPCDVPRDQAWPAFAERRRTYASVACQALDAVVAPPAPWTNGRSLPRRSRLQP